MYQPNAIAHMRPEDVEAFRRVARIQNLYILVRQTNPQSVQWISDSNCMSKPIDCKAKTADYDVLANGRRYETAGLVVNASLPGFIAAFEPKRIGKAIEAWQKFAAHYQLGESFNPERPGVRTWSGNMPGWATDMNPASRHYGCVMWSSTPYAINGKYVHGDYDLFGIVSAGDPTDIRRVDENLLGERHARGPRTYDVQFAINAMVGAPLIRHGEQELFADFDDESLDVFCPDGRDLVLPNAEAARKFYREKMCGRSPFTGPGVAAEGLWRRRV
jgi:hypothetical protein